MKNKSFFHLDCNPIIPDCCYQCDNCVKEIRSILKAKEGVFEVTLLEHKNISVIAVEHDSEIVRIEDLQKEMECLPSFYTGKFIPEVIEV